MGDPIIPFPLATCSTESLIVLYDRMRDCAIEIPHAIQEASPAFLAERSLC